MWGSMALEEILDSPPPLSHAKSTSRAALPLGSVLPHLPPTLSRLTAGWQQTLLYATLLGVFSVLAVQAYCRHWTGEDRTLNLLQPRHRL